MRALIIVTIFFSNFAQAEELWVCTNKSIVYGYPYKPTSTSEVGRKITIEIEEPLLGRDKLIYNNEHLMYGKINRSSKTQIYMNTVELKPKDFPHQFNTFVMNKYIGDGHFQILEEMKDGKVEYIETHYLINCENKT